MRISRIIVALFIFSGCFRDGYNETTPKVATEVSDRKSFPFIKNKILNLQPELASLSGKKLVFALRDFLHRKIRPHETQNIFYKLNPEENFSKILNEPQTYGHQCGGMSITYQHVLGAFGFESRRIQLIGKDKERENHVSTEVLLNGNWIISDVLFNVTFRNKKTKNLVSYSDLFSRSFSNFEWTSNSYAPKEGRSVREYAFPFKNHLYEIWYFTTYPSGPRGIIKEKKIKKVD